MNNLIAKENIAIVANFITIAGFLWAAVWGLLNKKKNVTGFKINLYISYIIKTGFIIVCLVLLLHYSRSIYGWFLIFTKGNNISLLWEQGKEFQHLISYCLTGIIVIFTTWIIVPIIWTSSFFYAIESLNLFLPKKLKIKTDRYKGEKFLEIIKATYGSDENYKSTENPPYDVTEKIKQMIKNNILEITASNNLAGDPHKTKGKKLIIKYKINGIEKEEIIKERETKTIPS